MLPLLFPWNTFKNLNCALFFLFFFRPKSKRSPFTVFAASNAAFGALFETISESDVSLDCFAENPGILADLVLYNVVQGAFFSWDLNDGQILKTLQGGDLIVSKDENDTIVIAGWGEFDGPQPGATVVDWDIEASNGVIHVTDQFLATPNIEEMLSQYC